MVTSQWLMLAALGSIAMTWFVAWRKGHRASAVQNIFAALCVQTLAAILLSFASGHLLLSLALAAIILGAVLWMIRSGSQLHSQRLAGS